jgi:DNA-binding transcriptional regulator YbjK
MATTRDRALAAAVELLGSQGLRALTHARVDRHAELPRGSTSNWFRTRTALVTGVVTWIAEHERADFDTTPLPPDPEEFVSAFTRMIEIQTSEHALRTRARLALFLDASQEAQEPLLAQRRIFADWMREVAQNLGMPQPDLAARSLMACADGLVLHRLTVDADAPVRPIIERTVNGCLITTARRERSLDDATDSPAHP